MNDRSGIFTAIMEAKLAVATDPDEVAKRQQVLDDHVRGQQIVAEQRAAAEQAFADEAGRQAKAAARKK